MKQFEVVQAKKPKRSAFNLSHGRKTTLTPGDLVPVLTHEVLPGDRFILDMEAFMRTLPLVSPVMHHVNLYAHAFFVPYRLLCGTNNGFTNDPVTSWEDFITGKIEADLPSWDPSFFYGSVETALIGKNSLADHLDYGDYSSAVGETFVGKPLSQMSLRAYHKIWSDYYRDQNYQNEPVWAENAAHLDYSEASNFAEFKWLFEMRKRCFEKDYFTSALLTQQRGAAVSMPLGDTAVVTGAPHWTKTSGGTNPDVGDPKFTTGDPHMKDVGGNELTISGGLFADLGDATAATISQLRQAFALQRWYEASMRFGQRYVEQLLGLFGVVSKDARLQRAEFLAGGQLPVQIGEVLQTSQSDTTPQGTMTGRAISTGQLMHIDRTFDEHGIFMVIVSVIPRTSYINWCARQNLKLDRFDFAFPQFAHLSEAPIYNAEIYQDNSNDMTTPFGYQPIYTEYRYIPDSVHGEFKDTLAYWSLAREFSGVPTLDETFVVADFPQDIFPVAGSDQKLILQTYYKFTAIRPLPKFGTPI